MNNLQVFRRSVKRFNQNGQIQDKQKFKKLINQLCDNKLLHPNQVKQLICGLTDKKGNDKIQFPLTLKKFEHLIMTEFGDSSCNILIKSLQQFQKILKQTKGTLNVWKDKGLSNEQKLQLQSIFAKGNKEINQLCLTLKKKKLQLQNISEQQIQMVNSLNQWAKMQKIERPYKNYQDYQNHNRGVIDKLLNKVKVKQVNFRSKKRQFKDNQSFKTFQGFDSKNDEPVQILLISKNSINFQIINCQLLTLQAMKNLFLSKHFPRYLGNNFHSDPLYFMYFRQEVDSINLKDIINKCRQKTQLTIQNPLFQYWATQIYQCLFDMFSMCCYLPIFPINLSDFQIAQMGLRVVLKNIKFQQNRKIQEKNEQDRNIQKLETQLLKNLGILLLQILNIQPNFQCIENKINKVQEQTLFKTLINIQKNHINFKQGNTSNYLSMFNIKTHPLFQAASQLQGQQIVQKYMMIYEQ